MHSSLIPKFSFLLITCLILNLMNPGLTPLQAQEKKNEESKTETKKEEPEEIPNPFPRRFKAPDLSGGIEWLNTSGEINLRDLRGKVVLLDFWTFCCINCIHVLPDLAYLEKKFDKELVVIGVHSAKFDNEKETNNIREAIKRYEISHPVVNDADMTIWRKMGARSWPTLVLIDPEGYYCGYVSGEGQRKLLENVIERMIAYHKAKGTLDETPVHFDLERFKDKPTPLKYPGKILADEKNNRLFISDSNHNRIVIAGLDGSLIDIIGNGTIGSEDGTYEKASFDHPQGMELVGETLYVSDTENHLLRTIDLKNKKVETLAGTGSQARFRAKGGPLKTTALNSPWALVHHDGILYIAMAGPHQIWKHELGSEEVTLFAGSGREDILDGSLEDSAFAQPSGITTDGTSLYIADSEGSAIRKIKLDSGEVTTVVGESGLPNGRSLFSFGDVDGNGKSVRLQHPLGVVSADQKLYITDTYNHKIKEVNLSEKEGEASSVTLFGDGQEGKDLKPVRFSEPAGLALAGETLFIADTNNHRIVKVNLKDGSASEFTVDGLSPPAPPEKKDSMPKNLPVIDVSAVTLKPTDKLELEINLPVPKEFKLNALFPTKGIITNLEPADLVEPSRKVSDFKPEIKENKVIFQIPFAKIPENATLEFTVRYGYCREGVGGICKVQTLKWKIPIIFDKTSDQSKITIK